MTKWMMYVALMNMIAKINYYTWPKSEPKPKKKPIKAEIVGTATQTSDELTGYAGKLTKLRQDVKSRDG